jgi:hypothetical protein
MKRGIILLLAASVVVVAAEEPQAPAAPHPDAAAQPAVPADQPTDQQSEALRWAEQDRKAAEQVQQRLALPPVLVPPVLMNIPLPGSTCYFIRMIRPVMPADQQRSGLIPLQSRVNAVQRGPDCSNGGPLPPVVPTERPDARPPGPALTPVLATAPAEPATDDR